MPNYFLSFLRWLTETNPRWLAAVKDGLRSHLVKLVNNHFHQTFATTPFQERLLFLPFCLRPLTCPGDPDREEGFTCPEVCPECELGKVRQEALVLGYAGVYVVASSRLIRQAGLVPSDQFILDKVRRHQPKAVLGVVCLWYVHHRLLAKYEIGRKGYRDNQLRSALAVQGVLLNGMNCRQATVDWRQVRERLYLRNR